MSEHRKYCDEQLEGLRHERSLILPHWRMLADFLVPRRMRWLIEPNEQKGSRINLRIIDETGTIAARTLTSGLQAGVTSKARPWFKLRIEGFDVDEDHPVQLWLHEVERRMRVVLAQSNFYNAMATYYDDIGTFGSGAFVIYEDFDKIIHCHSMAIGEFFFKSGDKSTIETCAREFTQTAKQLKDWFGEAALPEMVKRALGEANGKGRNREFKIGHLIEQNNDGSKIVPERFKYRETYWVIGSPQDDEDHDVLETRGFFEKPGVFGRWDVRSGDDYGTDCPGMQALPAVKQLQQEQKRKAQGIDKHVNPSMLADAQLEGRPTALIPGAVTFIAGLSTGNTVGMRPVYEVRPVVNELMLDIQEVQSRIRQIFFNDLFLMFQQMEGSAEPRSATIVDARREEKMVMIGPVYERLENEALDVALDRVYGIMERARLFPPPPPEIENRQINIAYVSVLAQAQRASETAAIERSLTLAGNIGAIYPGIMAHYDFDAIPSIYNEALGGNPKIIRDKKIVMQERQQKQQLEEAAAAVPVAAEGAKAAELLSKTNVGGGRSALQEMIT